ncbi:hypothetical protein BXZ70DRAFT_950101 [Cristinia sonorae]|uniref:NADAR domain-containing protein n=1 Tax=Cristinia sonorae TaxID=1940300 RepID=A0A8K0UJI2_9AGAR|nr:hypothetical protein BXZ70DRAFT_950101 [Cristinia sonorae]
MSVIRVLIVPILASLVTLLLLTITMRTRGKVPTPPKPTTTKVHSRAKPSAISSSTAASSSQSQSQHVDRDNYVFFWKVTEAHGYMSQWYHSPFTTRIHLPGKDAPSTEELTFLTAEHYMMACKALLFGDTDVFNRVLAMGSTNANMIKVKALGREVQNFDDDIWKLAREEIVLNGNLAKFREAGNKELREKLLGTEDKQIVEASPRDRVWGVGFGEKRALDVKEKWGLNLLGVALMRTREKLRGDAD